jgi:hypothetical protein
MDQKDIDETESYQVIILFMLLLILATVFSVISPSVFGSWGSIILGTILLVGAIAAARVGFLNVYDM